MALTSYQEVCTIGLQAYCKPCHVQLAGYPIMQPANLCLHDLSQMPSRRDILPVLIYSK